MEGRHPGSWEGQYGKEHLWKEGDALFLSGKQKVVSDVNVRQQNDVLLSECSEGGSPASCTLNGSRDATQRGQGGPPQ